MGFGFRKSFKVAPGVRINTGKRGASVSIGGKGLTTNISKRGTRTTASLPGTGLSYTSTSKRATKAAQSPKKTDATPKDATFFEKLVGWIIVLGVLYLLAIWIF